MARTSGTISKGLDNHTTPKTGNLRRSSRVKGQKFNLSDEPPRKKQKTDAADLEHLPDPPVEYEKKSLVLTFQATPQVTGEPLLPSSKSLSTNETPKQRRRAAPKATPKRKVKVNPDPEADRRPEPYSKPPAWAEERQPLCETLRWYRSYESGPYYKDGVGYGYLVDEDCGERNYMDSEIIITRSGGGCKADGDGKRKQTSDHSPTDPKVSSFVYSMEKQMPIGIIVGSKNIDSPTKPLHRYSVLGYFIVTDTWAEKSNGKICYKHKFQKTDLQSKSWWAPKDSADPPAMPNYSKKAFSQKCSYCEQKSKQLYQEGWMCTNGACTQHWIIDGANAPEKLTYHPDFVCERTKYDDAEGEGSLIPELPVKNDYDLFQSSSRNSWKGIVCPKCRRCNSRTFWNRWHCATMGCSFEIRVKHPVHSPASMLLDHDVEYTGRAPALDRIIAPVVGCESEFHGYWRIERYVLPGLGTVTHFQANKHINQHPGGAHDIFMSLQSDDIGFRRYPMLTSVVKGTMTAHFSTNFGMPYKFVVSVNSKSFSEAPACIMNGLNMLTWAGRKTVTDGSFKDFNELLALGYFEKSHIGWHDDGEKDLEGTIATLSLGAEADMKLRMKPKHYSAFALSSKPERYDPRAELIEGMQAYQERLELNQLYGNASEKVFTNARDRLFNKIHKKSGKSGKSGKTCNPPVLINMNVKHGDMVVMDGMKLQKFFEHRVDPKGPMRLALTSRYVKPETIPESEHSKAQSTIDPSHAYDGLPDLIQVVKAKQAEEVAARNEVS